MTDATPWHRVREPLASINPVPSMMSENESRLLHWAAAEYYTGQGEIVDAGCLLGGSTCALASGLLKNPRAADKRKRIHSYDIFTFVPDFKNNILKDAQVDVKVGESLLPVWQKYTAPYADSVAVYPGDFCQMRWSGAPIEICFIDLAKTWDLGNHVIREFFGALIPGRSLVMHQDYVHHFCYWIHLTMQFFAEYFERMFEPVGGTVTFRLLKPIPKELLTIDFENHFSTDDACRLMDDAIAGIPGPRRHQIATAKMKMLADRQQYEQAAAIGASIRDASDFNDSLLFDLFQAEKFLSPLAVLGSFGLTAHLVGGSRNFSIFTHHVTGLIAVHRKRLPADIEKIGGERGFVVGGENFEELSRKIGERIIPRPEFFPILLESHPDYQVVFFKNYFYRVPPSIKPIELTLTSIRETCPRAARIEDVRTPRSYPPG